MRRSVIPALALFCMACGDRPRATAGAPAVPPLDFSLRDTACIAVDVAEADGPAPRLPAARRLSCVLEAGSPPRALVLVADTAAGLVTGILLLDASGTDTVQRLPVEQDEPPVPDVPYVFGTDFDADGARDLALRRWAGATGNVGHEVWRFDRASQRLVHDSVLSASPGLAPIPGQPCVRSHVKGGNAGLDYELEHLCREGGRWVTRYAEEQAYDPARQVVVKRIHERRGDSLALVRVDTLAPPLP